MAGPSKMQTPAEQSGRHGTEIGPQNSTQATMGETVDDSYLTERQEVVYEARISHTYKEPVEEKITYELGTFASEDEAARAYDLALLFIYKNHTYWEKLNVITNFRPSQYSEDEILEAGIKHGLRVARTRRIRPRH